MKRNQMEEGRMTVHTAGLGTVTEAMVRQRAREIALINGREENQVLDSDLDQARREFQGQEGLYPSPTAAESLPESKRWSAVASSEGRKRGTVPASDEQTVAEKLVEEGVAEAEHEQQVEATRAERQRDALD
jgi:hypothetical protein